MATRTESYCSTATRKVNRPVLGGKERLYAVFWSCNLKTEMNEVTGFDKWFGCDVYQLFKFILIFLFHRLRVHAPPNADLQNHRRSFGFLHLSGTNAGKCHPTIHTGSTILWFYFSKNLFIINKQKIAALQGLLLIDNAVGGGGWHKNRYLQWIKKNIRLIWKQIV